MLFINVEQGDAQDRQVRVHPSQELDIPGYHLQVLAVDEGYVHVAIVEETD
jgi:hypothetical protein